MSRRLLVVLSTGVLLSAVLAGCSSGPHTAAPSALTGQGGSGTYQGVEMTPAQPRPSFTLTDTAGTSFSFGSRTAGHPTLLFFGYTRCPDVCPTTMADASVALSKVPAALASKTYVVFVSTDVEHDTGPVIDKWLTNFDGASSGTKATFVGLRGTQAQVDAAQAAAHVTLAEDGGQSHSAQLLLYGADDYAHVQYLQSGNEQQQIEHDLPVVAGSSS